MNYLTIFILLSIYVGNIISLKLLVVGIAPVKSRYTLPNELAKGLARAGHDVTMISSFSEKNPPKNFKEILIPEFLKVIENKKEEMNDVNFYEMGDFFNIFMLPLLHTMGNKMTNTFFEHPNIQKLLKSNETFDAVILEQYWNDAKKILAWHFNATLVMLSPVVSNRWVNNLVANPEPPSYVPDNFLSYTPQMSFYERMHNFLFGIISDLQLYLLFYPQQNSIIKKYFPNAPHLDEIQYNVSLVLVPSHESIREAVPHVPNMIDIAGFHVNPPKELPRDLKEFMDNATEGVIYFSLGSVLVPSEMPKEKKDGIIKALGSRKEKVLWKWDEDILKDKPDNMMIAKWFPQQAILAHPNCKLFITHGGLLSTIETIYMGVPVLALPVVADQKLNAAKAVSFGYGKTIHFSAVNQNNFAETLNELLENSSYGENAKLRSKIMHDRPVKPMDLANYWIEYVVRHKGAPHLRVGGVHLPLYKYYMLDVIGALFGGIILAIYLLSKLCRLVCWRKSKSQSKKKKD